MVCIGGGFDLTGFSLLWICVVWVYVWLSFVCFDRISFGICCLRGFGVLLLLVGPPLWSSGQSFWLQIQRSQVRFPALPDFLSSSGSGTGSTQPREVN